MCDLDVSRERHLGQLVDVRRRGSRPALRALRGLSRGQEANARDAPRLPAAPPRQGAGLLREHRRPHAPPDPRGGRAARLARGLPRRRRRPARPGPGRDPARASGSTSRPTVSLSRALSPPAGLDLGFRLRELGHLLGVALLVIVLLPLLLLVRAGLPRPAAPARAQRPGAAREGAGRGRPGARGARGPRRPQPVHGARLRQARPLPAHDADGSPLRDQLRDEARLQPRQPRRREDDPLRPLGLPRRQAPRDLRQQLRRQPRELHGRLHRQDRLGVEHRLQQRLRLSERSLPDRRRLPRRARVQGLPAPAPGADARVVLRLRAAQLRQHREQRADSRRAARRARPRSRQWVQAL